MRILFVFYNYGSGISFSPAIQMLSALAKREGHETKLLHFHEKLLPNDPKVYIPIAKEFNPDLICFTATDFEYEQVTNIANELKKELKVPFMLGGKSAIEIATKDIINTPFDIFCIGEAEIPFMNLLKTYKRGWSLKEDAINGFCYNYNGKLFATSLEKNIQNLDDLPNLDYDIFDTPKIIEGKSGWLSVQFSRSCIFNCTYCYVTSDKWYQKKQAELVRNNSVEYAIKFLESLCEKYPQIKVFNLDDELPISIEMHKGNKFNWWLNFCREYKKRIFDKYGIEFCCNGRIDIMNEEIIRATSEAGCREIRMGFECGSFRVRKEILDKPIQEAKMKEVYALCDKYSLNTTSFTMIGIPTENHEDINETIRMTAQLKPNLIRLTFCYPFENTRLWFWAKERNLINEDKLYQQHGYFEESVFKLPITDQELMAYKYLFPWYVNLQLDLPDNIKRMYKTAIQENTGSKNQFKHENLWAIHEQDKELSAQCGEFEHFCYFDKNPAYYHCKNKKYPKVRPIVKKKSQTDEAEVIDATGYQMPWIGDDKGYFLIRINKETTEIEVAHCKNDALGKVDIIIKGRQPREIYEKIIELGLISRFEHGSYLGKELTRAYISLLTGKNYIQDNSIDEVVCHELFKLRP